MPVIRIVYICAPCSHPTAQQDIVAALDACEEARRQGRAKGAQIIPVTPLDFVPALEYELNPWQFRMDLLYLQCNELWVAGDVITDTMQHEIRAAVMMGLPVRSMGMPMDPIQAIIDATPPRRLLNRKDCPHGFSLDDKIGDKVLVLRAERLSQQLLSPENQLWLARSNADEADQLGGSFSCRCLGNGLIAQWRRTDFLGAADKANLPKWARDVIRASQSKRKAFSAVLNLTLPERMVMAR
jgi:hypothetical protein